MIGQIKQKQMLAKSGVTISTMDFSWTKYKQLVCLIMCGTNDSLIELCMTLWMTQYSDMDEIA